MALIAQLIHDPPPAGRQEALLREIGAKSYRIPGSTHRGPSAPRTQVSPTTLRRYLQAYRVAGFEALRPVTRGAAGVPRALPPAGLARAIALREEQPSRTPQTLVDILQRNESLHLPHPINVHTLTTHLRRGGQTRRLLAQRPTAYRRFEREQVNARCLDCPSRTGWQGDALVGPWLPDPGQPAKKRRAHLFCFIDDHSRLVPHCEFFFDEALPRLERVLKIAILRRGLPQAVYVDNGQVYAATQFGAACAALGIRRPHTAPYSPESKGKQERFFGTLRAQFLPEVEASNITTLTELNASLWAWIERIYHLREHSETGQTPLARYTAGLDQVRSAEPETLRRAFLWREQRKVRRDATLALQDNLYQVDRHLAGRTLELCFDPFDLSRMELYLDGVYLGTATVTTQNRQRHLAVERLASEPLEPAQPKSALDFLAALRAEHQEQQRRELGRLEFARLLPADTTQE